MLGLKMMHPDSFNAETLEEMDRGAETELRTEKRWISAQRAQNEELIIDMQ